MGSKLLLDMGTSLVTTLGHASDEVKAVLKLPLDRQVDDLFDAVKAGVVHQSTHVSNQTVRSFDDLAAFEPAHAAWGNLVGTVRSALTHVEALPTQTGSAGVARARSSLEYLRQVETDMTRFQSGATSNVDVAGLTRTIQDEVDSLDLARVSLGREGTALQADLKVLARDR